MVETTKQGAEQGHHQGAEQGKDGETFANFHCSLISVSGKDSEQSRSFQEITKDRTNLPHFHADGAAEIASCFREVTTKVVMLKDTHMEVAVTHFGDPSRHPEESSSVTSFRFSIA
jgi:hypothetical protein